MSDTSYPVFQHYGTNAQRLAFTPNPAAGTQPLYTWYETDTGLEFQYTTTWVGPLTSGGAVPINVTSSQTVQTNTGWVVSESLIIDAGVILEIAGGARVEITGPAKQVGQVVSTNPSAAITGAVQIPVDDTIPQITEGTEVMVLPFTPMNASSTVRVDVVSYMGHDASRVLTVALFQDANVNAIAASAGFVSTANAPVTVALTYIVVPGTTQSMLFRVRIGANGSGTTTFNGTSGGRNYGAIPKSSMTITEYLP